SHPRKCTAGATSGVSDAVDAEGDRVTRHRLAVVTRGHADPREDPPLGVALADANDEEGILHDGSGWLAEAHRQRELGRTAGRELGADVDLFGVETGVRLQRADQPKRSLAVVAQPPADHPSRGGAFGRERLVV